MTRPWGRSGRTWPSGASGAGSHDRPGADLDLADRLQDATGRYLRILDTLTESGRGAPSLLPGWTRGHVVAHVACHGLATAAALDEMRRGRDPVLYESPERRTADIEELATADLPRLRTVSLEAAGRCHEAIEAVLGRGRAEVADRRARVFPDAERTMDVDETVRTRWREVEIHHADLAGGYGPADWPQDFTDYVLDLVVADRGEECDLLLVTPERDIAVGNGEGLRVEGMPAGLAWWLLGRAGGTRKLTGRLPLLSPWVRRA